VRVLAIGSLLEEAHDIARDATKISLAVGRDDTKQALARFLGEVGLLEDTLGRVDIWEVESGPRVAGVEYGRESYTSRQGRNHDSVHLVVRDVPILPKIHGVDDLVVTIRLVSVKVFCLSTVTWNLSVSERREMTECMPSYQNSGRTASRLASRP
jgi:hypothetical protein